jgi:hypothetical protein
LYLNHKLCSRDVLPPSEIYLDLAICNG